MVRTEALVSFLQRSSLKSRTHWGSFLNPQLWSCRVLQALAWIFLFPSLVWGELIFFLLTSTHPSPKSTDALLREGVAGAVYRPDTNCSSKFRAGGRVLHLVASVHLELPGKGPRLAVLWCALFYRRIWFGFSVGWKIYCFLVWSLNCFFCMSL